MRVVFAHSGNLYGGTERVLETVAQARRWSAALEPQFALCFDGKLAASLRQLGAKIDVFGRVRLTRPDLVLQTRALFAASLRANRPDVVVTTSVWSHTVFAPVARRARLPLILWLHDALSGKYWLEKLAGRHQPDLLICNSSYCRGAARSVFPSTPAEVVYCPVILDDACASQAQARRILDVPDNVAIIVNVARMEENKGQRTLIDALARLHADKSWTCWLVGGAQRPREADYERSLEKTVASMGLRDRVVFLGQRRDVPTVLAAADVFCHPNQGPETFGLSIIEALHARLPVVASALGGPQEILTQSCGRLVPAGDADALATALSSLLADTSLRRQLAEAGPSRALELCEPKARLADLARAFESVRVMAA